MDNKLHFFSKSILFCSEKLDGHLVTIIVWALFFPTAYSLRFPKGRIKSLKKGINKLVINEKKISADLEDNWAVVAEAIQTILRRESYPNPYETLKELTRSNTKITREKISSFIDLLDVDEKIKKELKEITPNNYTGI